MDHCGFIAHGSSRLHCSGLLLRGYQEGKAGKKENFVMAGRFSSIQISYLSDPLSKLTSTHIGCLWVFSKLLLPLLNICDGVRSNPKHSGHRNFPCSGTQSVHCHMSSDNVDLHHDKLISHTVFTLGIEGVFGIFAIMSLLFWIFVFLKVPETKGMPLEVISNFLCNVGRKRWKLTITRH
ncbi:hypothetical protein O6H91_10G026000 [Diphasiastrum complanatum]|uniref:Uncharacterized protein n=1 Tax=Diphasiastrum complanatum TaxID=34168 RepID=A0ACC2CF77_DIPCM|nr:hypothetical protein O6H91_10G026000 [Diphasiastrum complanatum]